MPFEDVAVIVAHGLCTEQEPLVFSVVPAQACFDLASPSGRLQVRAIYPSVGQGHRDELRHSTPSQVPRQAIALCRTHTVQPDFGLLSNGVNQARRGSIEAGDVLNTRTLAKLRQRRSIRE
jgi:hypothetical protein